MSSIHHYLSIVFLHLLSIYYYSVCTHANHTCMPDQASALLRIKSSFLDPNLSSWEVDTDCCHWEGISCDAASGRVIALDLNERGLQSRGLHPALFSLTSLQNLSLGSNDFMGSELPALGFERLAELIHLNLSSAGFTGQVPIGIVRLTKLVSLDLSQSSYLQLYKPSFGTFVANLSNLRELRLDGVDISSSGAAWSSVLAKSIPLLEILSLAKCGLSGTIHPSLSRLSSLVVISLWWNKISGMIPESFADNFSSLSSLRLDFNNFEGQFPSRILQLRNLKILDVIFNSRLSVHLPDFPAASPLEEFYLYESNFSGAVANSFGNLKSLKKLWLSLEGITEKFASSLAKLESLNYLRLSGSGVPEPMPSWIGTLKNLTYLELSDFSLSGPIPAWIGNLTQLGHLDLSQNNLSGTKPTWLGKLTQLRYLDLSQNNLSGTKPTWLGNLTQLQYLDLSQNKFSGKIPTWLGNLTQLQHLDLSENNFSGEIPKSLLTLPALQEFFLKSNSLSGPLPDFSTLSSSIVRIDLSNNKLIGSIPKSLFQLRDLEVLSLESNNLKGTMQLSSFWTLRSLYYLDLSNNMLSVIDGEGKSLFPSFPKINILLLASCNLKTLPEVLRYLDEINMLDLSFNKINGVIPTWIWESGKNSLEILNLSHNMFTSVEQSLSLIPIHNLNFLDLSFNRLQGNIPIPLSPSYNIQNNDQFLDYSNNKFSFLQPNFTTYLSQTAYLNLSSNKLNGHIPTSICSASNLQFLDLSYNNFSGLIPSCLTEGGNKRVLKLRGNYFDGMLPKDIREGCNLQTIDLNDNLIEGTLPRSLSNCTNLEVLDVGNNYIMDTFPSWLGNLSKLQVLVLRSNMFYGSVESPPGGNHIDKHFSSLKIIDLASNNFGGNLYPQWFEKLESMKTNFNTEGQVLGMSTNLTERFYQDTVIVTFKGQDLPFTKILAAFKVIDFSNNRFDGDIPESIGKLVWLHGLNMSHNAFTGHIPSQLGGLAQLESLDLSRNQLSGAIPEELTSLTSLAVLNLSFNNLSGRIPQGKQFSTFANLSFEGNTELCGSPLSKQCSNSSLTTPSILAASKPNGWSQDRIGYVLLFLFAGLGFGLSFAMVILLQVVCGGKGWSCKYFRIHQ